MTRIEGPGRTGAVDKTGKTKKTSSTSGASFADLLAGEDAAGIESVSAPLATGAISALLTIQANEQATEQESRRRAVDYSEDLLDDLDNIRIGLLMGNFNIPQLQALSQKLQVRRLNITDPGLLEMVNEIEMRVRIELAKFGI